MEGGPVMGTRTVAGKRAGADSGRRVRSSACKSRSNRKERNGERLKVIKALKQSRKTAMVGEYGVTFHRTCTEALPGGAKLDRNKRCSARTPRSKMIQRQAPINDCILRRRYRGPSDIIANNSADSSAPDHHG